MRDELTHESFVVLECDDALVLIARDWLLELHSFLDQSLYPKTDRARKNGKRRDGNLSTASRIRPGEKSQNAARRSGLVAEIEMIGCRIVEVHGALDEPHAEDTGIEIEISLRIARDTGNVMNAGSPETHS